MPETPTPELLALTAREDHRERVVAATPAAQRLGIRSGMPAVAARALCASLQLAPIDPEGDRQAWQNLASILLRFTPMVCLEPLPRTYRGGVSLSLEIGKTARHFGGEKATVLKIRELCARLGYTTRFAVAPTRTAARLLARAVDDNGYFVPKTTKKKASKEHDSEEQRRVLKEVLSILPWSVLDPEPQVQETFQSLGLQTLGDLMNLPEAASLIRLGDSWHRELRRALGHQTLGDFDDPPQPWCPPSQFEENVSWWPPTEDLSTWTFAAKRALDALEAYLNTRQHVLFYATITLRGPQRPPLVIELRPRRPTASADVLLTLFQKKLEQTSHQSPSSRQRLSHEHHSDPMGGAYDSLHLHSQRTERVLPRQSAIFSPLPLGWTSRLAHLFDRLTSRLGHDRVLHPELVPDHRPERAFDWSENHDAASPEETGPPARRPLELETSPTRLDVACDAQETPRSLRRGLSHEPLRVVTGPERIESGWWEGRDVRRLYFEVEASDGTHLWIFRDLETGQWFRHGAFS